MGISVYYLLPDVLQCSTWNIEERIITRLLMFHVEHLYTVNKCWGKYLACVPRGTLDVLLAKPLSL